MPKIIYAVMEQYIAERAASYSPNPPNRGDIYFGLNTSGRMMRDIWLENGITLRQAVQRYGLTHQEAKRILERWWERNDVTITGSGRGARYMIPSALQQLVNKLESPVFDYHNAYWVLPGKLLFGNPPRYTDNEKGAQHAREGVRNLLDQGIDAWLDVQIIRDGETLKENPFFLDEANLMGRAAIAQYIPLLIKYVNEDNHILVRRSRPNRKDIYPILDQIDHYLANGRVLYVSASERDLRGILAGCYLARHGQAGNAALEALQACRATISDGWRREPPTRKARRYVRSWPKGL